MSYSIAIAGSTDRTVLCAKAIQTSAELEICLIITPTDKLVGRKQLLTANPLKKFANSNNIPTVLIKNKIDEEVKNSILAHKKPDFILVVDFGYLVPQWLLELPQIKPLNIHPSLLPRWRGTSPGQYVLLAGEETSAVSMIEMTDKFDQGSIIWQQEFTIEPSWTQTEYYQHSFELATRQLASVIIQLATGKITPTPQPDKSPTSLTRKITKEDAFIDWNKVSQAMTADQKLATELERASRAYAPWPLLWTKIETAKGQKRMQIISTQIDNQGLLVLDQVKIEGMTIKPWSEVKNVVI